MASEISPNRISAGLRQRTKTGLTPELREEIETLLRRSSIRHGQAFRGMERGATAQQLAEQWGDRTVTYVRSVMRSVQYMLDGELPGGAAMSYENSFGYRELWDQGASPELLAYVKNCLRELKRRNPCVKIEPTGRVAIPGGPEQKKFGKPVTYCGHCYLEVPCDCD